MSFFGDNDSIYMLWAPEPRMIRPLVDKPFRVFMHNVPSASTLDKDGGIVTLRRFGRYACPGRSNDCFLCNTKDPLWSKLGERDKYKRDGSEIHFGFSVVYFMPVWDYEASSVKIMRGPQSAYEAMDHWHRTGRSIKDCDWMVSRTGTGFSTRYEAVRNDASPFQFTEEIQKEAERLLAQANEDNAPPNAEFLERIIQGDANGASRGQAALPGAAAPALPPAPPPSTQVGLVVPIQKDPSGHYALDTSNNWVLVTEAKARGIPGSEYL